MSKTTERFGLPRRVHGHVQMKRALERLIELADAGLLPEFTEDDIGKTLGVVDDGDGNAVLGWVGD